MIPLSVTIAFIYGLIGLVGKDYDYLLDAPHRWSAWAAPKDLAGGFDHDNALIGDDLIDFVNKELFPYLTSFKERATGPDTIEYKIGEIFGEIGAAVLNHCPRSLIFGSLDDRRFTRHHATDFLDHLANQGFILFD